jgi:serine/threonine protein kinase
VLEYTEENQPTVAMSSEQHNRVLAGYELGKTIGKGTFGKVKLGRHILTGEKVHTLLFRSPSRSSRNVGLFLRLIGCAFNVKYRFFERFGTQT